MSSSLPARPFSNGYLLEYSGEHVVYEFGMFLWSARVCDCATMVGAPSAEDATRLRNALIESFVVHLRNVIVFFYPDGPRATDVVAADFFGPDGWTKIRPKISGTLQTARVRANKELAHLTTGRITGSPPEKGWDFSGLATEIRPLMDLFARHALVERLSPKVTTVIG